MHCKVKNKNLDEPSLRNSKADVSRVGPLIRAIASRSEEGLTLETPALECLLLSAQLIDLDFRVFLQLKLEKRNSTTILRSCNFSSISSKVLNWNSRLQLLTSLEKEKSIEIGWLCWVEFYLEWLKCQIFSPTCSTDLKNADNAFHSK